ncbi:unnamed protein product [Ilex paraguariensis]|uniref:Uncharacterized protein n=2 Tax=Ilex paraguariensis TaxID=185542 RepID=A0ABC8SMN5_9AQUA
MMKDEWVTEALVDDMVVVELLCRLKQSSPEPPPVLPPLGWGNRQPRSKLVTMRKESSTTFSPTTPLSWSDGVGGSATPSDGESSRPSDLSSGARSKGPFTSEINSMCTTTNASRRKKTFIELKEEANVLLKERRHLKRELASMQVTLKEQRDTRENLKRIKLDLSMQSENKVDAPSDEPDAAFSDQCKKMETYSFDCAHSILQTHGPPDEVASSDSNKFQKDVEAQKQCFMLPDLNMPASEEERGFETTYGMS